MIPTQAAFGWYLCFRYEGHVVLVRVDILCDANDGGHYLSQSPRVAEDKAGWR